MQPILNISVVSKRFGAVLALEDVSLSVAAGTVHCILGENGAGKSTLCNLVYGGYAPTSGSMELAGRPYAPSSPAEALKSGVAMVHQHFSLVSTMTVRENLLLGGRDSRIPPSELDERLERLDAEYHLRVDPSARVGDMPVGSRQKAEIVKALLHDPQLLLLDEPTGVLDVAEIEALIKTCRAIAASGRAVVLVTHKLGEVARVADEATVLRGGGVAGGGRLAEVPIPRLLDLMVGRQVTDLDPALAATLGVVASDRGAPEPVLVAAPASVAAPAAAPLLDAHPDLAVAPALSVLDVSVQRRDGALALDGADLSVAPGEIVGIAGVEGNGQSELVSVISGSIPATSGRVEVGGVDVTSASPGRRTALGIGVVPEDRHAEGMVSGLSIAENLFLGRSDKFRRKGLLDRKKMNEEAAKQIERYSVRAPGPEAPIGSLSGGNQQKVVLARELAIDGLQTLVAAQPTRGLDIGAVDNVHNELRAAAARGVGVLVVSSELPELLALCSRVFVAYRGQLLGPVDPSSQSALGTIGELMTGTAA